MTPEISRTITSVLHRICRNRPARPFTASDGEPRVYLTDGMLSVSAPVSALEPGRVETDTANPVRPASVPTLERDFTAPESSARVWLPTMRALRALRKSSESEGTIRLTESSRVGLTALIHALRAVGAPAEAFTAADVAPSGLLHISMNGVQVTLRPVHPAYFPDSVLLDLTKEGIIR